MEEFTIKKENLLKASKASSAQEFAELLVPEAFEKEWIDVTEKCTLNIHKNLTDGSFWVRLFHNGMALIDFGIDGIPCIFKCDEYKIETGKRFYVPNIDNIAREFKILKKVSP